MRKTQLLALATALFLAIGLSACSSKKEEVKNAPNAPTEFEQAIDGNDSTAVVAEIDKFYGFLKEQKPYEAAAMLVKVKEGAGGMEVEELDNKALEETVKSLKLISVVEHKIQYIKFHEYYKNEAEVHVTMIKGDASQGIPDATTKMYLVPVMMGGNWKLALLDSPSGDRELVNPEKRDSLRNRYRIEEAVRN